MLSAHALPMNSTCKCFLFCGIPSAFALLFTNTGWANEVATVALNNYDLGQPVYQCINGTSGILQPVAGAYLQLLVFGHPVMPADGGSSIFGLTEPGYFIAGTGIIPGVVPRAEVDLTLRVWRGAPAWEAAPERGEVTWRQETGAWDPSATPPQPPIGPPLRVPFGLATTLGNCGPPIIVFPPEFYVLTNHVSQIVSPGAPGPVEDLIPDQQVWRTIVSGDEDTSWPSVFCLARQYERGRVIVLGHDGILFSNVFDNARFLGNLADWLNQSRPKRVAFSSGHQEFARTDNSTAFTTALAEKGFEVTSLDSTISIQALQPVDILVVGNAWGTFSPSEVAAVKDFVTAGGGLLLVGVGWSWIAYNAGATLDNFPMAVLAAPYGVRWRSELITDPSNSLGGAPIFHVFNSEAPSPHPPGRASAPSFRAWGYDSALAQADVFYAEAIVEASSPGTFYAVMQGEAFYLGLQHGGSGYNKHVHFAVWDPADAVVFRGEGVIAQRFGGEGEGWTTYYPFDWKTNVPYRFLTQIISDSRTHTLYRAYFYDPEPGHWKHLATMRRMVPIAGLNHFGSFLEDFGEFNWLARSFRVGRQWARYGASQWLDLRRGYFDCSISAPHPNSFDGDLAGEFFRLETGGKTVRDNHPGDVMLREDATRPLYLPVDPPRLGPISFSQGQLQFELRGAPGLEYQVQVSTNLTVWTAHTNLTLSVSPMRVNIVAPEQEGPRFYRSSLRQP